MFYIRQSYIVALTYRSELVLWMVLDTIPLLLLFLIWVSAFNQQPVNQGYTLPTVLQYYFLGMLISAISSSHFEGWRVQQIREGKIDFFLIRPLSYLQEILLRDIGGKLCYISIVLPFYCVLFLGLTWLTPLSLPGISLTTGILFAFLLLAGYLIEFCFALIIVLLGFWFEGAEGLEHFKWILVTLLSGFMIPIPFMPTMLQTVVNWLPFKYMYAIPISLVQNQTNVGLLDWLYIAGFIAGLAGTALIIWQFARFKYASSGG